MLQGVTGVTKRRKITELYDYQNKSINELKQSWRDGYKRPCIVLPCGAGKSVIASEIAKRSTDNGRNVLFLVHRQELCDQIRNTFTEYGVNMNLCTVNMVQTVSHNLDAVSEPSLIITDENHHCIANTYKKIYSAFPKAYCVGLTATPVRLNGGGLGEINDKLIIGPTVKQLITQNRLAPYRYYAPALADVSKLVTRGGDYAADEVELLMDKPKIYGDVIKFYNQLGNGGKAVCYCATIRHSKAMAEQFTAAGIPARHIDGSTPKAERAQIVADFRSGKIRILCNVDLISEGFDVPDCSAAILLRPTKSLTLYIQQAMRCMRYQPDKTAVIIDHVGNVHRHGLPDADHQWTLEPKPPTKKQAQAEVKIKQCPECYYTHVPAEVCPNCGHVYEKTEREIKEQQEAKLIEITSGYTNPSQCSSIQEIFAYVKAKGYKKGYAYYLARERGWLR